MRTIRSSVNLRRVGQIGVDVGLLALAYYLSYVLRFDEGIPHRYQDLLEATILFVVASKIVVFALFGLYCKLWRFVDQKDVEAIVKAVVVATVVLIAALFLLSLARADPPRGVIALDFLLTLAFITGSRFLCARCSWSARSAARCSAPGRAPGADRGSGQRRPVGGLRAAPQSRLRSAAVGFLDDDPRKHGMRVAGPKVLGTTAELPARAGRREPDEVIIAIPSAPGTMRQTVVTACRERSIPVRTLPTTFELLCGGLNLMRQVREVRVEDVLGREPVRMEIDRVGAYLSGAWCS